jgi:putative SOS response-associated peptidase YedK
MFAGAFGVRRAIVPATEFYLRNKLDARGARRYGATSRDGEPLGLAALWSVGLSDGGEATDRIRAWAWA